MRDYLRKRQPDLEPPLLAAIDAFDTVQEENRLDSALLAPIVDAASSSRRPLLESATGFLGKLTGKYPLARQAVEEMALHPLSHVRFNAILCLKETTPRFHATSYSPRAPRQSTTFGGRLPTGLAVYASATSCLIWHPHLQQRRTKRQGKRLNLSCVSCVTVTYLNLALATVSI